MSSGEIIGLHGGVLNPKRPAIEQPPAEKPKQLPTPATYHLVCLVPEVDKSYDNGLVKAGQTIFNEEVLTPVLFVAKMGPDAFKDAKRFPSGPSCKEGDFVIVRPNSGTRFKVHGQEIRIIADESVEAVVDDPRAVKRVF